MANGDPLIIEIPPIDLDAEELPMTEAELEESRRMLRDLDLASCDFCGGGCCDPDCWRCYSPLCPENLQTLAKNLANAGQLMRAWQLFVDDPTWYPGCALDRKEAL